MYKNEQDSRQRRVAAAGVFTNRKMGDVFSFLDSFLEV